MMMMMIFVYLSVASTLRANTKKNTNLNNTIDKSQIKFCKMFD